MEEANIGRVADPAAGSGYLETLTDQIARAAWSRLQVIEAAGGLIAALESGLIAGDCAAAVQARRVGGRVAPWVEAIIPPAAGGVFPFDLGR